MAALALLLSACGVRGPIGDKAGGVPGGRAVLLLATVSSQIQERPAVEYFISRVESLSGGNIRIAVRYNWASTHPDAEQQVVKAVAAGTIDLGVVGTQVLDTLGVRGFQALNAPLLVSSYPLEEAILRSGIPREMLASVGRLDVNGLALLGNGLRKPVGVAKPLLGPANWRGITFGIYKSNVLEQSVRALRATPLVAFSGLRSYYLSTGRLQGYELNVFRYYINGAWSQAHYITANVNLWPQVDILMANPWRLAQLTSQQQGWLEQAARDAADRSVNQLVRAEIAALPAICAHGTRFAYATRSALLRLRQAFMPVYSRLEQDPQTNRFIARIERIKRALPPARVPAIPRSCLASGVAAR